MAWEGPDLQGQDPAVCPSLLEDANLSAYKKKYSEKCLSLQARFDPCSILSSCEKRALWPSLYSARFYGTGKSSQILSDSTGFL